MKKTWILFPLLCLLLTGCSSKNELEDKAFVLALGIDASGKSMDGLSVTYGFPKMQGDSEKKDTSETGKEDNPEDSKTSIQAATLYEAEKSYDLESDKRLDYSHLKAILFNRELFENTRQLTEVLGYLERQESFARNTKVFIGEWGAAGIVDGHEDAGAFLNDMYENGDYLSEDKAVTLQQLLNHWHNQDRVLLIPVTALEKDRIRVTSYAVISRLSCVDYLSVAESDLIFFARGVDAPFSFQTDGDILLEIQGIQRECIFQEEGEKVYLKLYLTGQARRMSGEYRNDSYVGQISRSAQGQITTGIRDICSYWQLQYGVDLLDAYRILGSHNRGLWLKYEDQEKKFVQDLEISPDISLSFE